ncbi:MAG: ferredoxin reductase [Spirochaetales bacterium]|nr:ferredoxin reductase [Leptospiraceae bacterium]MCP5481636.1 ferredoxin reductase [Spirochaetales bacterium]MCP5484464.1 ferredoxin reductase [Spirochaetales bacterium]
MKKKLLSIKDRLLRFLDLFTYPRSFSDYAGLIGIGRSGELRARVVGFSDETPDSRTIFLRPGRAWKGHQPGQFLELAVPVQGVRHSRSYSISSAPATRGRRIAITVKAITDGRVSQFLVRHLKKGAVLPISQARGDFVPPPTPPPRSLFITAGSGITPIMSMLRSYAARSRSLPDIVHLHYAPRPAEVIFNAELSGFAEKNQGYRLHRIYTRLADSAPVSGHFTAEHLDRLCPDWRARMAWVCGPAALLDTLETHWATAGLQTQFHAERFRSPAQLADLDKLEIVEGNVHFKSSETSVQSDGRTSLLELAEQNGLKPAHGCRMGICHTCDCVLRAGRVRDLRNGTVVSESGIKIQACVSAALGDVEVEL